MLQPLAQLFQAPLFLQHQKRQQQQRRELQQQHQEQPVRFYESLNSCINWIYSFLQKYTTHAKQSKKCIFKY